MAYVIMELLLTSGVHHFGRGRRCHGFSEHRPMGPMNDCEVRTRPHQGSFGTLPMDFSNL
jgi:hypothetical protein